MGSLYSNPFVEPIWLSLSSWETFLAPVVNTRCLVFSEGTDDGELMKTWTMGLVCLVGCLGLLAGEAAPVELRGIVKFPDNPQLARVPAMQPGGGPSVVALIEYPSKPVGAWNSASLLGEGQREGDLEVLKIDATAGTVQVKIGAEERQLMFASVSAPQRTPGEVPGGPAARAAAGSIRLENARLGDVLAIYQKVIGRTLLCSSAINRTARANLSMAGVATAEEMAKGIERALPGLVFHTDGDKFEVVGRKGDFEKLTPELRDVARKLRPKAPAPPGSAAGGPITPSEEVLPAGVINFQNTDFSQVLQIFQELLNRTLLRSALWQGSPIYLKTQTPLTRDEAVYAMCAVLALDGISLVDWGDKFVFAFPTLLEAKRKELFARKLPSHADVAVSRTIPAGMGNARLNLSTFAKIYGDLAGQPVELDQELPERPFSFRLQTPLTAGEVLHGLDLLLGWEGLEVVKNKDGSGLRLTRVE